MNTKLFAPAVLAAALGFSSLTADAVSYYPDAAAPAAKTSPVSDMEAAKAMPSGSEGAKYVNNLFGKSAPNAVARPESDDGAFKNGIGPAKMFQLRDAAGG
jgi:hypothetical protein